jgi:hypothetical protein
MLPHGSHVARFTGDHSQVVAEALSAKHYVLQDAPSIGSLRLVFPYGAHWVYHDVDTGHCVSITLRRKSDSTWLIFIRPDTPIRPDVVSRRASCRSSSIEVATVCFAIAQTLHATLAPRCSDLRWGTDDNPDSVIDAVEPISPRH